VFGSATGGSESSCFSPSLEHGHESLTIDRRWAQLRRHDRCSRSCGRL
jgi:hypothetical protein